MSNRVGMHLGDPATSRVLWYGHCSPWYYLGRIVTGWLLAPFLIGFYLLLRAYVNRASLLYCIEESKITTEVGYLVKSTRELRISDVRSINVQRRGLPGWFNVGTLEFASAAHAGAVVFFYGVEKVEDVANVVRALQAGQRPAYVPRPARASMIGAYALGCAIALCMYGAGITAFVVALRSQTASQPIAVQVPTPVTLARPSASPVPSPSQVVVLSKPASIAATPSASPAPTSQSSTFLADVKVFQRRAIAKYPELAVGNSPFNRRFVARYKEWQDHHDPRLDRANWPEVLAEDCATHP